MRTVRFLSVPAILFLASSASLAGDDAIKLGKPVEFSHAGIRIAFPARHTPRMGADPWMVYVADPPKKAENGPVVFLGVVRAPLDSGATAARKLAGQISMAYTRSKKGKDVEIVSTDAVKVAGRDGWRLVRKPKVAGKPHVVATTAWTVSYAKHKMDLVYMVQLGDPSGDAAHAVRLIDAICRSVKHVPVVAPNESPLPPLVATATFPRERFSIQLPRGWFLRQQGRRKGSSVIISCSPAWLVRSKTTVNVNVTVVESPADPKYARKGIAESHIKMMTKGLAAMKWTHVSHRLVKLAGQDALEILSHSVVKGQALTHVLRQCWYEGRIYTITVTYLANREKRGERDKQATAAMKTLAGGFKWVKPSIGQLRFKCLECDHEWEPIEEDLKEYRRGPMMEPIRLKCPKCGWKTGVQMTKCPKCGKWFVPDYLKPDRKKGPPAQARVVCPHCATDVLKYHHLDELRKKRRSEDGDKGK